MISKARIFLVEDDADLRASLAEVLELEGYEVRTASGALEAIAILEAGEKFDLIISDHHMRDGSGIDLLKFVRGRNPVYPVFFLVTGQSELTGTNARNLGAQEFILKPFEITVLFDLIESHLARANWIAGEGGAGSPNG